MPIDAAAKSKLKPQAAVPFNAYYNLTKIL